MAKPKANAKTKPKAPVTSGRTYQLKVTLSYVEPPVWRRVIVPGVLTLYGLHSVIQIAMGWEDDHLHEFRIKKERYGNDPDSVDESTVCVQDVLAKQGSKAEYVYDFGDHWSHEILVEKTDQSELAPPICLAGQGACPPENCGGPPGYADLLDILADPNDDEYEDRLDWVGGQFDPTKFDLAEVNKALKRIR